MAVPCGQRTELRLKIVSRVCYTDHKRGKTFDWNKHKKVLLKAGKREELHLDPANQLKASFPSAKIPNTPARRPCL